MYLINYNTGVITKTSEKNANEWVKGLSSGTIVSVVDLTELKALVRQEKNIGWAEIPQEQNFTEEELAGI